MHVAPQITHASNTVVIFIDHKYSSSAV